MSIFTKNIVKGQESSNVDLVVERTFNYLIPEINDSNEVIVYGDFLRTINDRMKIAGSLGVDIRIEEGLDIYNTLSSDLLIRLYFEGREYKTRLREFPRLSINSDHDLILDAFREILHSLNRYLFETRNGSRFRFLELEKNDVDDNSLTISLNNVEYVYTGAPSMETDAGGNLTESAIMSSIDEYDGMGLFENYAPELHEVGVDLAKSYLFDYPQDILWCFRNLITPISVLESYSYKDLTDDLIKITGGALVASDYEETIHSGRLNVSFKVNDKQFISENLPLWITLRFVRELNDFLEKNLGSSFYIWHWDKNSWEGICVIYFTILQYQRLNKISEEFSEIDPKQINFYDEDRIIEDQMKSIVRSVLLNRGYVESFPLGLMYPQYTNRYTRGHERFNASIKVKYKSVEVRLSAQKYFKDIERYLEPYRDLLSIVDQPTEIQFTINLNQSIILGDEFATILGPNDVLEYQKNEEGLAKFRKDLEDILNFKHERIDRKYNDISYLNNLLNKDLEMTPEIRSHFNSTNSSMIFIRLIIAKLSGSKQYNNLLEYTDAMMQDFERELDSGNANIEDFKYCSYVFEKLKSVLSETEPLEEKELFKN